MPPIPLSTPRASEGPRRAPPSPARAWRAAPRPRRGLPRAPGQPRSQSTYESRQFRSPSRTGQSVPHPASASGASQVAGCCTAPMPAETPSRCCPGDPAPPHSSRVAKQGNEPFSIDAVLTMLKLATASRNPNVTRRVSGILRRLGFERQRRSEGGRRSCSRAARRRRQSRAPRPIQRSPRERRRKLGPWKFDLRRADLGGHVRPRRSPSRGEQRVSRHRPRFRGRRGSARTRPRRPRQVRSRSPARRPGSRVAPRRCCLLE
ncbi:hypothetical protein BH11MYX4_BH11MYX4_05120 [soil metagenome]